MRTFLVAAVCLAASLSACKRSEDQAAKARIFSPEEPVGMAAEATEKLDAHKLADDPALAARVLKMPRGEIVHRIGSHKAQQRVQFAWFRGPGLADGGSDVALSEEAVFTQSKGNDFGVRLSNDRNQGFELVWAQDEVFVRGLFGPFRKRRTDRTEPGQVRDQVLSGLATFDRLARGLKLAAAGETTVEGRRAVKYKVAGFGARPQEKDDREIPKVEYPEAPGAKKGSADQSGPDADTARRLELWEKEQPVTVSGTLLVDAQTAAPLAAELQGRFRVPSAQKDQPAAELEVHTALTTSEIGAPHPMKQPQYEPEPSQPHAVKDPLRFLGKAAQPGKAPTDEGQEDDSDSDTE